MERVMYQGKFIKVTEEDIQGHTWERVYLQDGVQVFPINSEGKIALIVETRPHEKSGQRLKFVTGLMDSGEEPLATANREMQEEIGVKAEHLEILTHRESSGTINNNFYQIIATNLKDSKIPNPDGEETILSVKYYTLSEIEDLINNEKLPWSMGVLGFYKIKNLISKGELKY